jgi:prefoldin alpha subunit
VFYEDKVKGLDANLQELEKIVQEKNTHLRVTEESECFLLSSVYPSQY